MDSENRLRILIIDDDQTDREIYRQSLNLLEGKGFEFAEADSGTVGIRTACEWSPDCVLLDYSLPDMDGLEVLARLRNSVDQHPFPIVMLTAYGGEALAVQAMKAGVMDYLPKRHAGGEWLSRAIDNAIEKFRLQRQVDEQRAQLERSAHRYQVLLESIPQMVWKAHSDGSIEYANRRWLDYTDSGPAADSCLAWDRLVHPEDRERTHTAWQKAAEAGAVFEAEHRLRRAADGEYRWHLVRAVPLRNGDHDALRWFGTCTEIEDQKRNEESMLQRQKLESIGRLAGGIAHDFNNLLAVILGGASFASDTLPPDNPVQGILKDVVFSSERAAQLTRKLLAYAGRGNLFPERVDVPGLVRQVCQGIRPSLDPSVRPEVREAPNAAAVQTDLAQMRQTLHDLILNAVEALPAASGTVSVSTRVAEIGPGSPLLNGLTPPNLCPGSYVSVEIRDNGCGMDEETQRKIFDPFFSTKGTGRGLGLAGVQGFVRSNHGYILVESAPAAGTLFRILLPAMREANVAGTSAG